MATSADEGPLHLQIVLKITLAKFNHTAIDKGQVYNRQPIVPAGITAVLECDSEEHTKWFYENTHTEILSENNVLILFSVSPENSGTYLCFGKYKDHEYYFVGGTTLQVIGKITH